MKGAENFFINKKSRRFLKFLIGGVVFLFLLFIINFFTPSIKNSIYTLFSPIQKIFWAAGESSAGFFGSLFKAGSLKSENENLKKENQELIFYVASLQSIAEANRAQSDVSLVYQNSGFKLVMAGIIGLDENDILSINKGSADGISEGMPVINQRNVLFGKVFKVYKNFSSVMLVSNKNSVVNVKIQQAEDSASVPEIDGAVKGNGGLKAYLDFIPIDREINQQDILVTSAIEKSFPKDLLVARVSKVEKNDQKPFQQAQLSLFLDVKAIDNLFVITNYKQTD